MAYVMKLPVILWISFGLLLILAFSGCNTREPERPSMLGASGQRVIKMSFRGQHNSFRMRVNQGPIEKLKNADFTNVMTQLKLDYGDIVVWEAQRDEGGKELSQPWDISTWWFKHLEKVRASFYCINSDNVADFFATPIYHWESTPEKPRPLNNATFLVDGVALGRGLEGFRLMLDAIDVQRSGPVFILAPRIKNEGEASPWIADDQLLGWAEDAGLAPRFKKIRYSELTDFARFADE